MDLLPGARTYDSISELAEDKMTTSSPANSASPTARLALFGPAGFGAERLRAIHANPHAELVAVYSPILAESQAAVAQWGGRLAHDEAEIWDDPTIDAVVLSTPNQVHLPHTLRAAATGKHVLVEKPIAVNLNEGRQMVEACQQAGVILMVGHNARRRQRKRLMKQLIEQGQVGRILAVEAHNSHRGGMDIQPGDWRNSRRNCPGGSLIQLGIHHADTLQYLAGPVRRVQGWQRRLAIPAEIEDTTLALLEFESGALGYLGANYAHPHLRFTHVLGTEGNLRWDSACGLMLETEAGRQTIPYAENDTLQEEIDEFIAVILRRRSGDLQAAPEVDGWGGLRALAVIEAAWLSQQRGRPVDLSELGF